VVCADALCSRMPAYWPRTGAAATQNILLACHALGLGAVWIGVYPREERVMALRELLSLPVTVTPLCTIAIGRPEGHPGRSIASARIGSTKSSGDGGGGDVKRGMEVSDLSMSLRDAPAIPGLTFRAFRGRRTSPAWSRCMTPAGP